jgi:hypothetical protein
MNPEERIHKRFRDRRREAGVCIKCGASPCATKRNGQLAILCESCLVEDRQRYAKKAKGLRRYNKPIQEADFTESAPVVIASRDKETLAKAWATLGWCAGCGAKYRMPGSSLCGRCEELEEEKAS